MASSRRMMDARFIAAWEIGRARFRPLLGCELRLRSYPKNYRKAQSRVRYSLFSQVMQMADREVLHGRIKVIRWDEKSDNYYGFIERRPDPDVWFAASVVRGLSPVPGDTVAFVLAKNTPRVRASEVWRVR